MRPLKHYTSQCCFRKCIYEVVWKSNLSLWVYWFSLLY